jgi:hypothetical protein
MLGRQPRAPTAAAEYRVEYAPRRSHVPCCTACSCDIANNGLRIGVRSQPQSRQEIATAHWRWYHLQCLAPGYWIDARMRGISNIRGISASDQAMVRERLSRRA